jgi:hypothetical protein
MFGLPLLNKEDLEKCFVEDFMSYIAGRLKLTEFMDYLIENYTDYGAKFPISM